MVITKGPAAIHTAFNPIVFKFAGGGYSETSIKIIGNGTSVELKKSFFNGKTIFDISPIVKKLFSSDSYANGIFITDKYLCVDYTVVISGVNYLFTAINAVVQIGESSSFVNRAGSFLTEFERIKIYPGYERIVGVLGYDNKSFIVKNEDIGSTNQKHFLINITNAGYVALANKEPDHYLTNNSGEFIITTNAGEFITIKDIETGYEEKRLYIDKMCIPLNPFYVRWVNAIGGYDYWMFSIRRNIKTKSKVTNQFEPVIYDQEIATSFDKVLSIDAEKTIVVGAENLNVNEFTCIEKIQFSPKIQYLKSGKWFDITIDSISTDSDTFESLQEIELSFNLPQQQLQF